MQEYEQEQYQQIIQIPTGIQYDLNRILIEYTQQQKIRSKKNSYNASQQYRSRILKSHTILQLNTHRCLQIKIFDRHMSSIINELCLENVDNLRGVTFMIDYEVNREKVIIVTMQSSSRIEKNQKKLTMYTGKIEGDIVPVIEATFTLEQEILAISDAYIISANNQYYWLIITEYGRIFLLVYKQKDNPDKSASHDLNIIGINETSPIGDIFKTMIKPFFPPQYPYEHCKIFFCQKLHTFILLDFTLQLRLINFQEPSDIVKTPVWELNLAKILPSAVKSIIYIEMLPEKSEDPSVTFIIACYEQDYSEDTHLSNLRISLHLVTVSKESSTYKIQNYSNFITFGSLYNNSVCFQLKGEKLWVVYGTQTQSNNTKNLNKQKMYRIGVLDVGELCRNGNLRDIFKILYEEGTNQNGTLIQLEGFGVCFLSESNLMLLDSVGVNDQQPVYNHKPQDENGNKNQQHEYTHQQNGHEELEHSFNIKNTKLSDNVMDIEHTNPKMKPFSHQIPENPHQIRKQSSVFSLKSPARSPINHSSTPPIDLSNSATAINYLQQQLQKLNEPQSTPWSMYSSEQAIEQQINIQILLQLFQSHGISRDYQQQKMQKIIMKRESQLISEYLIHLLDAEQFVVLSAVYCEVITPTILSYLENQEHLLQNAQAITSYLGDYIRKYYHNSFYKLLLCIHINKMNRKSHKNQYPEKLLVNFVALVHSLNLELTLDIQEELQKIYTMYDPIDLKSSILKKYRHFSLFKYLLLLPTHKNKSQQCINQTQFVEIIDGYTESRTDHAADNIVQLMKQCINRQKNKMQALTTLVWLNCTENKNMYFPRILEYLMQVSPKTAVMYSILAGEYKSVKLIVQNNPNLLETFDESKKAQDIKYLIQQVLNI